MTKLQYLLTCLAEECNEVAQMASKCMRFGVDEMRAGQPLTNAQRLQIELGDLLGVVDMLELEGVLIWPRHEQMHAKKQKVEKYMAYSVQLGILAV